MASSSDWITELANSTVLPDDDDANDSGSWLDVVRGRGCFVEGAPFDTPAPAAEQPEEPLSAAAETSIETQAEVEADPVQEAYERGKAEGHAEAKAEGQERLADQRALRLSFHALDEAAMDSLAAELAETVLALCSGAISEFRADPEKLAERCAEAAKRLGAAASECKLHLHPDDIEQLDPETKKNWTVVGDETVERSGLRFEGPDGSVSDSPEDWRRAIAAAIKG